MPPRKLLVVPSMSNNILTAFDLDTHEVVKQLGLPKRGPSTIFASPDGNKLYCLASGGCDVVVVDVDSWTIDRSITVPGSIVDRGQTPAAGSNFWVGVILQGHIHAIDTATGKVLKTFPHIGPCFAVSYDETTLYTLALQTRKKPGLLRSWSVATGAQLGETETPRLKGLPLGLWRHREKIYFTELSKTGAVHVLDVADATAPKYHARIAVGSAPLGADILPDGMLWVPNSADGTVSVIDTASDRVVHTLDVGRYVGAVSHLNGRIYLNVSRTPGRVGFWRSMWITIPAPYLGVYVTPLTGAPKTRRWLDHAAEVIAYDARTYEPLPLPPMTLPSIGFTSAAFVHTIT